jgi:hypothetical protein
MVLLLLSYGCETSSPVLVDRHRPRVFEDRMLKKRNACNDQVVESGGKRPSVKLRSRGEGNFKMNRNL